MTTSRAPLLSSTPSSKSKHPSPLSPRKSSPKTLAIPTATATKLPSLNSLSMIKPSKTTALTTSSTTLSRQPRRACPPKTTSISSTNKTLSTHSTTQITPNSTTTTHRQGNPSRKLTTVTIIIRAPTAQPVTHGTTQAATDESKDKVTDAVTPPLD